MHGSTVPTQTVSGSQSNNPNATQLQTTQSGSQQPQSSQTQQQVNNCISLNFSIVCKFLSILFLFSFFIFLTQSSQSHSVDPKHVNPPNPIPFHLYGSTPKREYGELHTNTSQATTNPVTVDGKQTQISPWGYDASKVD